MRNLLHKLTKRSAKGSPTPPDGGDKKSNRRTTGIVFALVVCFLLIQGASGGDPTDLSYSEFIATIDDVEYESAEISYYNESVTLTIEDELYPVRVGLPRDASSDIADLLIESGIEVKVKAAGRPSLWIQSLIGLLPFFLIVGIAALYFTRNRGTKLDTAGDRPTTRFADVAGVDEVVDQLRDAVAYLENPEVFHGLGVKPARGFLLHGPPGTGKTLMARAIAGEAGVAMFSATGSDFAEMFVGVGPKRVRKLFAAAREAKGGAIVFIDELDSIAGARTASTPQDGGSREAASTLTALLSELDGFEDRNNIIFIGATNLPSQLDSALLRKGRVDRQIEVGLPDRNGRTAILKVHGQGKRLDDEVNFEDIAAQTPGMSGADLAELLNSAGLIAIKDDRVNINNADIAEAITSTFIGEAKKSAYVTPERRRRTAIHEAGHAITGFAIEESEDPVEISIIPRGQAGGFTRFTHNEEIPTRGVSFGALVVAMGGRAAETVILGDYSAGAAGDIADATARAQQMVVSWGMSTLGPGVIDERRFGEGISEEAREEVRVLVAEALRVAEDLVRKYRTDVEAVSEALIGVEDTLLGEAFVKVCEPGTRNSVSALSALEAMDNRRLTELGGAATTDSFDVPAEPLRSGIRSRFLAGRRP